jgi:sulfur carrier protein ThiS
MPECDYCGASFDSEKEELRHLKSEHRDELGPIDKRRIGDVGGDDGGLPTGPIALGVVLLASVAIVGYVVFVAGSGGGSSGDVGSAGSAHYHGTMNVTVTGDQVDFSQEQYQVQDQRFHFEGGDATRWHAHATGLTFEYAIQALGFDASLSPNSFTIDGTTYTDGDGYDVVFEINGEPLEELDYVLQEGDNVEVVVAEA